MTMNAFIFSWDMQGIESIIPISKYEHHDKENLIRLLKDQSRVRNPLDSIINQLIMRARFNSQRHYEIYAIDCDISLDEDFWKKQWADEPQYTAELIRERGHKLYSDRVEETKVVIR
jgi:hypothetical protein